MDSMSLNMCRTGILGGTTLCQIVAHRARLAVFVSVRVRREGRQCLCRAKTASLRVGDLGLTPTTHHGISSFSSHPLTRSLLRDSPGCLLCPVVICDFFPRTGDMYHKGLKWPLSTWKGDSVQKSVTCTQPTS